MVFIEQVTTSEVASAPVVQAETGETKVEELIIGDPATTGFTFPTTIGTSGQVLIAPVSGNTLVWGAGGGGGGGDITNGGQSGAVIIGSTDNQLTLEGNTGVKINGGLDIQFDAVPIADTASFNLTDAHHVVDVTSTVSATTEVVLPESETREGKLYIISKGYSGGTLTVNTQPSDTIDGDNSINLSVLNQRISLVSAGTDRWLII